MTSNPVVLQAPADTNLVQAVIESLDEPFQVATPPSRLLTRTTLDTFDRRVRRAGMALHLDAGRGGTVLHLATPNGAIAMLLEEPLPLPVLADGLPAGDLAELLVPVMEIRAIAPVEEQRRRTRRLELRDKDSKLVATVTLDEPARPVEGDVTIARAEGLRGYEREARRAVRALSAAGLRPAPSPADDQRHNTAEDSSRVTSESPATALLASALAGFHSTMIANLPGLLDDVDTEFLHDFRVAVRRTRSTLKAGRQVLPGEIRRRWEPSFKWLGDLTTPVRDLDVYLLELPEMEGWLVAAEPQDLAPFRAYLLKRRTRERSRLVRGLSSARFNRVMHGWVTTLDDLATREAESTDAAEFAAVMISAASRRVLRKGSRMSNDSPAQNLHDLRKRCKELRYVLELCGPVLDARDRKTVITGLKGLQDVLGKFQDSEVQLQALREFAEDMLQAGAPASALLAMGELTGHLETAQADARRAFDAAFAAFAAPGNRKRLDRMGRAR